MQEQAACAHGVKQRMVWLRLIASLSGRCRSVGQVLEACNAAATFFEDRAGQGGGGADFEGVFDAVAVLHALVALAESLAAATPDSEACTDALRSIAGDLCRELHRLHLQNDAASAYACLTSVANNEERQVLVSQCSLTICVQSNSKMHVLQACQMLV